MSELNLIPPGHGEDAGPGRQFHCLKCGQILSRVEPDEGVWVGWCSFHGTVEAIDSQTDNDDDEEDHYE